MANRRNGGSVTLWQARGICRKHIGGRMFYFGRDQAAAEAEAAAIKARWRRLKAEGHTAWPKGEPNRLAIQEAQAASHGSPIP